MLIAPRLTSRSAVRSILLNFGPQHPAAHGILKISLALSGEIISRADAVFGLLHRGSEKLCEARTLSQAVPYLDRMDYVANLIQEHALTSAIECLDESRRPSTGVATFRVMCDELSRVLNHLLTMSAICLDLGSMGPVF
jgi:NADH-quinone oxidoreductase subunit D